MSTRPNRSLRSIDAGWSFRRVGEDTWLPAQVPGSNFTDLWRAGVIEDPYVGDAENRLQWIEQEDWEYRCRFDASADELSRDSVELVFEGLDTLCAVSLNGTPILTADNMFRSWRCDVKSLLRAEGNELALRFASPVTYARDRQAADGFHYPAENDKTPERASVYVRKAPFHFGWDWGPKYVTSGVWRPVRIDSASVARITDASYRIVRLDAERAELTFSVEVEALAACSSTIEIACAGVTPARIDITLAPDGTVARHEISVVVDNPRFWWPNGLGEAHLYPFVVRLIDGDVAIDERAVRVGLRTIRVRNELDAIGESFFVEVNGRPVFMKGANYIPPDSFMERMTADRYERLFRDTVAANMNMLRVWGGGVYEADEFYDLADEHGILIWQDFMFSCTLYPFDPAFLANVAEEAAQNVRRLCNHPSLALWCGNNEVSLGIAHWNWPETFGYSSEKFDALVAGNRGIFERLLADAVAQDDPDRFYLPSSPIGFWNDPTDDSRGDNHFWGVWHGEQPFSAYAERVPRFMSEFGFQSYPAHATIAEFTDPDDRRIGSDVLKVHQKHARGDAIIQRFVRDLYGEPRDFESFCYLSQLAQADGLKVAFEAHRRAMPRCMGSLYWQINDCWPSISWSSIDYAGRWKALHHQAARSFAPLLISVESIDDGLAVHLVSDRIDHIEGALSLSLVDLTGAVRWQGQAAVSLPDNTADIVARIDSVVLREVGTVGELALLTRLHGPDGQVLCEDARLLDDPLNVSLRDPKIAVKVSDGQVVVSAENYARSVQLIAGEDDVTFADNFFDLPAGVERRIGVLRGSLSSGADVRVLSVWNALADHQDVATGYVRATA